MLPALKTFCYTDGSGTVSNIGIELKVIDIYSLQGLVTIGMKKPLPPGYEFSQLLRHILHTADMFVLLKSKAYINPNAR